MFNKRNGGMPKASDLEIEQPLKHRPRVLRVTLPDGRSEIFGDGHGYSGAERIVVAGGLASSTTPRLADNYTEEERAELRTAEARVETARVAVDRLLAKLQQASKRKQAAKRKRASATAKAALGKITRRYEEAREVEREARVELNRLRARIAAAARIRMEPPAPELPSLGERVAALEEPAVEEAAGD